VHSLVVGVALAIALTLLGLNVVIIHEMDSHFSLGSLFPTLALLLLLLHHALLSLLGLRAGFGLGVDDILINEGIIEFGSVHSMVIGEEVVNIVASIDSILLSNINLLNLRASHFLSGLHAIKGSCNIFVVVQAGSSKNSSILGGSSAKHIRVGNFIKIANLCHHLANWSWLWVRLDILELQELFIEMLHIILDELIILEGHDALLNDGIVLSLLVESRELCAMNFLSSLHGAHGG